MIFHHPFWGERSQQKKKTHPTPGPSSLGALHGSVTDLSIQHPLRFKEGTPTGRCWPTHTHTQWGRNEKYSNQ